jgi:hypothetical protein
MKKTETQAVSQQLSVLTAQIGTNVASYLVPDYNEGQKLAIIDEGLLKYLKDLLPTSSPYEIINNFISRMKDIRNTPCTLEAAVKECKDFVAFHEGINLMKRYFDPKTVVTREEPFNLPARELTISEKVDQRNALVEQLAKLDAEINEWNMAQLKSEPEIVQKSKLDTVIEKMMKE